MTTKSKTRKSKPSSRRYGWNPPPGSTKKDFPPFLEQVQFLKDHNASRDEYILLSILYSYEINKIKEGPTEEQLAALINAFNLATSALFVIDNPPNANDQTAGA